MGATTEEVDNVAAGSDPAVDKYGFVLVNNVVVVENDTENLVLLRRRESKWLEMLAHWDGYMMKNYSKVRSRCRKGIPPSVRPRAWLHLCGAKYLMERRPQDFTKLLAEQADQRWTDDIEKDLHRNFPTHEMFGGTFERIGRSELFDVLKAYSVLNPVDGYCQAQAPLAAALLMVMPAEQAFWCLVAICEKYVHGYYSAGLEALQLDGDILMGLLKKSSPAIHKHMKSQGIEPILFMTEWFLCLFTRTLPWPTVMRVWDMFMCEGVKVLFRVGLVLVKFSLTKEVRKRCPSMYETLDVLKNLPGHVTEEKFLVQHVLKLNIAEEDMEREHKKQLLKRRQLQQ